MVNAILWKYCCGAYRISYDDNRYQDHSNGIWKSVWINDRFDSEIIDDDMDCNHDEVTAHVMELLVMIGVGCLLWKHSWLSDDELGKVIKLYVITDSKYTMMVISGAAISPTSNFIIGEYKWKFVFA